MSMTMNKGYQMVCVPGHSRAWSNGYVYFHLLVAEQCIGRPLGKSEFVHHVDGNKCNNSPENLQVVTRSEHSALHHKDSLCAVVGCSTCGGAVKRLGKLVGKGTDGKVFGNFCNVLCQGRFLLRGTE